VSEERERARVRVRIGVVGAGFMGRSYARIVNAQPAAELIGVADINGDAAVAVGADLGAPAFPDAAALLDAAQPDGLIVATAEDAHMGPATAALERGVGVLVEKPIAATLADAEAIVAAADRSGATLMVGHLLRFDARYALVQEQVAAGAVGQPLIAYARRHNGKAAQDRLRGRCSLPLFLGVHDYDALRWILASEVISVVARERRGFLAADGFPVEDASVALLGFADGTLATVDQAWILPHGHPAGYDQRLEINGTAGRVELVGHESGVSLATDDRVSWPDAHLWPTVHGRVSGALERETLHFLDCLRTGSPPLVSGADGVAALRIALAVEEAARTGREVRLDAGAAA
jgi:predicted dehydrogenase